MYKIYNIDSDLIKIQETNSAALYDYKERFNSDFIDKYKKNDYTILDEFIIDLPNNTRQLIYISSNLKSDNMVVQEIYSIGQEGSVSKFRSFVLNQYNNNEYIINGPLVGYMKEDSKLILTTSLNKTITIKSKEQ